MIRAVVFDMDGTLLDTEQVYQRAWREAAHILNFTDIERALSDCTGRNGADTRRYFEHNYADVISYDDYMVQREKCYDAIIEREGVQLKAGAKELLCWLKARGIRMAVGTSTLPPRVYHHLGQAGIRDFFDVIITGDMVTRGKPDPETFLLAAERLGVDAAECMGVEDSLNGVRALHAAGMVTVMVPDVQAPTDDVLPMIDALCKKINEIQPLIEKNQRAE